MLKRKSDQSWKSYLDPDEEQELIRLKEERDGLDGRKIILTNRMNVIKARAKARMRKSETKST